MTVLSRFQELRSRLSPQQLIIGGTIVGLLVVLAAVVWRYQSVMARLRSLNDPQALAEQQARELAQKVSELIVLPDELPTVATVTDPAALPKQPFFANAAKDDQVLLYAQAKKVFLYRPSQHKIIDVAALSLQTSQGVSGTTAAASPEPALVTVALYNGTTVTGLTGTYENRLREQAVTLPVTVKTNAQSREYSKSLIIDVTGSNTAAVSELATKLKLEVGSLPAGEEKPATDILIIIGSDFSEVI